MRHTVVHRPDRWATLVRKSLHPRDLVLRRVGRDIELERERIEWGHLGDTERGTKVDLEGEGVRAGS
jgi:hypothetical protein